MIALLIEGTYIDGEEIECTGGHPFYVEGKGFIPAKELKSGDKCLLSTGEDVTIEKVEVENLTEAETTYNFEVADFHTYYVTEKDVLVHNKCWGTERKRYWKSQGEKYGNSIDPEKLSESGTYKLTQENIDLMKAGKAPMGIDGHKVHLHHVEGKKVDLYNYTEITKTNHYAQFKDLHPWMFKKGE